jgi:hypothetical protein
LLFQIGSDEPEKLGHINWCELVYDWRGGTISTLNINAPCTYFLMYILVNIKKTFICLWPGRKGRWTSQPRGLAQIAVNAGPSTQPYLLARPHKLTRTPSMLRFAPLILARSPLPILPASRCQRLRRRPLPPEGPLPSVCILPLPFSPPVPNPHRAPPSPMVLSRWQLLPGAAALGWIVSSRRGPGRSVSGSGRLADDGRRAGRAPATRGARYARLVWTVPFSALG